MHRTECLAERLGGALVWVSALEFAVQCTGNQHEGWERAARYLQRLNAGGNGLLKLGRACGDDGEGGVCQERCG